MDNHNAITGCTGSAVKIRHCPATVKDEVPTVDNHCAQREGDSQVLSQETGPVRQRKTLPRGRLCNAFLLLFCCLLLSISAFSLVVLSRPSTGTVTDSLGAVIPGATVVLMQERQRHRHHHHRRRRKIPIQRSTTPAATPCAPRPRPSPPPSSEEVFAEPGHSVDLSLTLSPSPVSQEHRGHGHRHWNARSADRHFDQRHRQHRPEHAHRCAAVVARSRSAGRSCRPDRWEAWRRSLFAAARAMPTKFCSTAFPINDIGGGVDFSYLQADGFDRVEFQRGPNSALYGSDALASVVSITTQHGDTPLAAVQLRRRWRNLRHLSSGWQCRRLLEASGLLRRLLGIRHAEQRSRQPVSSRRLSGQPRISDHAEHHACAPPCDALAAGFNSANAVAAYGIPDDAATDEGDTSSARRWRIALSDRWHNLVQLRRRAAALSNTTIGRRPEFPTTPMVWDLLPTTWELPVTQHGANGYTITPAAVAQVEPWLGAARAGDLSVRRRLIRSCRRTSPTPISFMRKPTIASTKS